ncbi:MAG: ribonuclease J [Patescibacteria group bacterium]|nr:ribonuclease J [Patescibacteria group bacterium]MCL5431792.1 ribonuclease J [Patescibacteria group bacterium]
MKLKILSLGGIAVNKNMYVYETDRDIIIVDCGIAFPDEDMPGIDLIIPDTAYLQNKKNKIRAIFLTHGHEDHRGALPYILPNLPKVPIYGTKLTIGLSKMRVEEAGVKADWREVNYGQSISVGDFTVNFIHVTHSIPDAANLLINTPAGLIYHGSDFKFDWTPVDGFPTQVQRIAQAGGQGILCLLSDCLRVEKPGYTLSERMIEQTFESQIQKCAGKFIITTQSSNISRIQQAVNVAQRHDRMIVFAGRSIEQSAEVAVRLGYLTLPKNKIIKAEDVSRYPAGKVMVLATGSQGQDNSALARIANGEHKIKIAEGDFVVFSQDPIPGSETAVDELINTLIKAGADVFYSAILDDLHVSGHEAADGLKLMLALTSPKYVWPIGGTIKHVKQYARLAQGMGYKDSNIILPEDGEIVEFEDGKMRWGEKAEVKNVLIDGLGVGDVGTVVLRDRRTMSADGVVMVVVPVEKANGEIVGEVDIVSRGFVYMKESGELINEAKSVVQKILKEHAGKAVDFRFLRRHITDQLDEFLFKETHRRPLILPVIVET